VTASAVTNSTCLIALERIGRLDLLSESFARVLVPPEVRDEFGSGLDWVEVRAPVNAALVAALRMHLHPGEAAAIALAVETPGSIIILDDRKARGVALQFDIPVLGTIGLLLHAKRAGIMPRVTPLFDALREHGFYLAESLRLRALSIAQEDSDDPGERRCNSGDTSK